MARSKIKLNYFSISFIIVGIIGTLSTVCESKALGTERIDFSTKAYIDEDREHQVPETTTDFPKTTQQPQSVDGSRSLAQLFAEETSKADETTTLHSDNENLETTTTSETDLGGGENSFSTNEIKMSSFEDATSSEKKFHAEDNNRVRNNSTIEQRRFIIESITNEETTQYYQTSNTVKIDTLGSDESTASSEEKTRVAPSVSPSKASASPKKGKNLDLSHSESDNVNLTIPNNAEVWSLAGMKQTSDKRESTNFEETTSGRRESTHSDAKTLSDWMEIARMSEMNNEDADELLIPTTEPDVVTTVDKITTTTVLPDLEPTTTTAYSTIVEDKATTTMVHEDITTTFEKTVETTSHAPERLQSSTEGSDEDIITISSALSGTTEPIANALPTTSSRVQTTMTQDVVKTSSTMPTLTTTAASHPTDDYISASSEPVFRVTPPYESTFYTENDRDKYNAANEHQITTDSSEITTSKQNVNEESAQTSSGSLGVISAVISVVVLLSLIALLYFVIKKRKEKQVNQRCRPVPVGLDAYSLDNVSVFNSIRRKANAIRASKRSYDNSAFEDPTLRSNVLDIQTLKEFVKKRKSIEDEFKNIPTVSARIEDLPENVEDKNRFANVLPLSQTRVMLKRIDDDEKSEYINANYVKGPKDTANYYIATQGPLECTIPDFWRMMWEQNSRVIIMLTDFHENGIEKCAQYIPSSVVLDNSQTFGDFEVTLKSREVKEKYAVSKIHLKNLQTKTWREVTHFWYSWPTDRGCPADETSVISLLLEARTFLSKTTGADNLDENSNMDGKEKISTLDKTKSLQKIQGPLTVHCNNGVGRTGAIIACDIVLRYLEVSRQIDIPQIVWKIRRDRANSIRTKDQYEFIYHIASAYASTLTTSNET